MYWAKNSMDGGRPGVRLDMGCASLILGDWMLDGAAAWAQPKD
jgi:hypothetical protein